MKVKKLRYSLMSANLQGEYRHAQTVMKELGIIYNKSEPQSMADSWSFYDCDNVPDNLPSYLNIMTD